MKDENLKIISEGNCMIVQSDHHHDVKHVLILKDDMIVFANTDVALEVCTNKNTTKNMANLERMYKGYEIVPLIKGIQFQAEQTTKLLGRINEMKHSDDKLKILRTAVVNKFISDSYENY